MRVTVLGGVDRPAGPRRLPHGPECAQLSVLAGSERRRQWLTSRHALRVLLGLLGLPRDTAACSFPHPRLSLTHADARRDRRGIGRGAARRPRRRPGTRPPG